MTRCAYIYGVGDKKVIVGKYQVGEQCRRVTATDETQGFCFGHFKKWNKVNDPAANSKLSDKQKATMLRHNKKREQKNKDIIQEETNKLSEDAQEILHVMKADKEYDLAKEYNMCKLLNINPTQEKFAEKFSFAMWLDTAEALRTPKELEEVCVILNVGIFTLNLWKRSPEIARIINDRVREIACGSLKYVWEKVLEGVSLGDNKCKDMAMRYIEKLEERKEQKNTFPDIPRHLVEEATGTTGKLDNVANQALKVAVYDALVSGNIKPNDTVQ